MIGLIPDLGFYKISLVLQLKLGALVVVVVVWWWWWWWFDKRLRFRNFGASHLFSNFGLLQSFLLVLEVPNTF